MNRPNPILSSIHDISVPEPNSRTWNSRSSSKWSLQNRVVTKETLKYDVSVDFQLEQPLTSVTVPASLVFFAIRGSFPRDFRASSRGDERTEEDRCRGVCRALSEPGNVSRQQLRWFGKPMTLIARSDMLGGPADRTGPILWKHQEHPGSRRSCEKLLYHPSTSKPSRAVARRKVGWMGRVAVRLEYLLNPIGAPWFMTCCECAFDCERTVSTFSERARFHVQRVQFDRNA